MDNWTSLFEQYHRFGVRFARRLLPDSLQDHAEDAVQKAWLQLWERSQMDRPIQCHKAYLLFLIRRRCQDCVRRNRHSVTEFQEWMAGAVEPPRTEERMVVEEAMEKLPLNWRRTVIARTVMGMSAKQSARYLIRTGVMAPGGNEEKRAENLYTRGIRRLRETVAA